MMTTIIALTIALSPAPVDTINLSDVQDIDSLSVCATEDCSDIAVAEDTPGLWVDPDTGNTYLTFRTKSLLIVDDTVTR